MSAHLFDRLTAAIESQGTEAALGQLAEALGAEGRFHERFDARLLAARARHGLDPAASTPLDDLPEPARGQLEAAYLAACREAGEAFLRQGALREAWMYLRPVGEREALAAALEATAVDHDNVDLLVELALHEGIHPSWGYAQVLKHYGTCSAISHFDAATQGRSAPVRQSLAELLVRHLHGELMSNLRADIARREGVEPPAAPLAELLAGREGLFADLNYHVDASHLAATVRVARLLESPEVVRLAAELADYGRHLDAQYQYAGDEPFSALYPDSLLFFRAQLGEDVEEAIAHFARHAEAARLAGDLVPVEVYVALLARLGRTAEALDVSLANLPRGAQASGLAPAALELARRAGRLEQMLAHCREQGDVLGYAAALAVAKNALLATPPRP